MMTSVMMLEDDHLLQVHGIESESNDSPISVPAELEEQLRQVGARRVAAAWVAPRNMKAEESLK
jgi:hypothetical protein